MAGQESFTGVDEIIEALEYEMHERADLIGQASEELRQAEASASEARDVVNAARRDLAKAEQVVEEHKTTESALREELYSSTREVGFRIAEDETIDPLQRTLHSLVIENRYKSPELIRWDVNVGRVALHAVMERLDTEEPLLIILDETIVAGDKSSASQLIALPPKAIRHPHNYARLEGGSIGLVLADAFSASAIDYELVSVVQSQASLGLMGVIYGSRGTAKLESAAENNQQLVIGNEAVSQKLEQLGPVEKLVALTALRAAGINISVELDESVARQTEDRLVALIASLAAGAGEESITQNISSRNFWSGGRQRSQVTKDTMLTTLARDLDKRSIRSMTQAIGLSKDDLSIKVQALVRSRGASDTAKLDQLAQDLQSLTNVDQILDAIFD